MSEYREITFGTTRCRIYVRKRVDPISRGPFPSEATAFVGDEEVVEDREPVEFIASTDDHAVEKMCQYLETRFGSRQA